MRITSGIARGISLDSPKGDSTRPATDAARQAIFSSLAESVADAKVLDMFAGTGAYGLEAASRGAREVTFVENDRRAFECLKKNIGAVLKSLRAAGCFAQLNSLSADCLKAAKIFEGKTFDFVFADPPYRMLSDEKTLGQILNAFECVAGRETVFILEAPADFDLPCETFGQTRSFNVLKRLGKKSKGKPSQIIFKIEKI